MKTEVYMPPLCLQILGACTYELEIEDESKVYLFRRLKKDEIEHIGNCEKIPWKYDMENNREFIEKIKDVNEAVKLIKKHWESVLNS